MTNNAAPVDAPVTGDGIPPKFAIVHGDSYEFVVWSGPDGLRITVQSKARDYDDYHRSQASGTLNVGSQWMAFAESVVPPGMVIAPAGDVLTAEDRAAIGRMVRSTAAGKLAQTLQRSGHSCVEGSPLWEAAEEELAALDAITDDDVARFRKLAAGGTE